MLIKINVKSVGRHYDFGLGTLSTHRLTDVGAAADVWGVDDDAKLEKIHDESQRSHA